MTTHEQDRSTVNVFDDIRGARDAMTVRRVFGDPYEIDGVTVIPVGRVYGGGGGGAGEGDSDGQTGSGYGTGFGLGAHAIGVYEVRDGQVVWRPAIDATRLARNAMALVGLIAVCISCVMRRRFR